MDGLEPIHEAQERDRKDPFLQRSVPLESNPGHLRTNDSPAKELTAGRSVRKRARARSRSAQNPENPPFEARALKQPLGSTVALQRSAAGFALEIAASLIMSPQTESRRARAGTASKVGVVNVPAKRKVEYQKHASIMAWASYGGEVGGLHCMLASDADSLKKGAAAEAAPARMRPEWTFGVPRVKGKWGNPGEIIMEPSFILNEKGGMQGNGLQQWVEQQIVPAYPNMAYEWKFDEAGSVLEGPVFMQLDAGPDRLTDCSLEWRQDMWDQGLILFPGLPNGTSGNQLCDDLFGVYKTGCDTVAEDIVSERVAAADLDPTVQVKLDFCDLGRIINGKPDDPEEKRPFCNAFTPEKILSSVKKLGLNPINLEQAISHRRVRDDSKGGTRTDAISKVRSRQETDLGAVQALGLNSNVLNVPPPKPKKKSFIAPPSTEDEKFAALKENSSVGTMWWAVGSKAFNAPVITAPAVARLAERKAEEERKQAKAADSWSGLQLAARELEERREQEGLSYEDLSAAEVKQLVGYVFRARKSKGVSEHQQTPKRLRRLPSSTGCPPARCSSCFFRLSRAS